MEYLSQILETAFQKNASDIHLIVGCAPVLRVTKELIPMEEFGQITPEMQEKIVRTLCYERVELINMFQKEKMLDIDYKYKDVRFRVNLSYSMSLPVCTMRIIKEDLPKYESLNLPDVVRELTLRNQGMILVTGKPGSGKTTTLNALVNEINERQNKKIMFLEKPIEYVHKNKHSIIVQKEIGAYADCQTYHDGVKNALREDCDVLVIGEIRDKETMDAAIEMAETGHLVIGTLHTKSCAETIDRIINFYTPDEQQTIKSMIASIIRLILSQRMLRGMYDGLVMIPEVLVVDDQISGIIKREKFNSVDIEDAMLTGRERGNCGLVFALSDAIIAGKITLDQAEKEVDLKNQELLKKIVSQGSSRRFF